MQDDSTVTKWQEALLEEAGRDLSDWQRAHPKATFAEIEDAVERRIADVRARLTEDLVRDRARADEADQDSRACPRCGKPMESRGGHERTVTIRGNRQIRMRRPYMVCPACNAGLFPPG
jgi:YgiT-type zinc finger domain-containing protein